LAIILMTTEIPEGVLAALREDPLTFVRELQIRAAVKRYNMKRISQIRAAEIAGVSCSEFIEALGRFGVSALR
jgi:predicted HTH domain antitoxin